MLKGRRTKLLKGLSLTGPGRVGMEIGPLASPLVTRADANMLYVDQADTATLRRKYRDDPEVDVGSIVDVDIVVNAKQSLSQAMGDQRVDFVVASHVVEHVPDFIGWFQSLKQVLRAEGEVRLAVPDMRFSFDRLRAQTRLSDILAAYVHQATVPMPHCILDFCLNQVNTLDVGEAWRGPRQRDEEGRCFSFNDSLALARDALENGTYHDVHCWTFTPQSFAVLCRDLVRAELMPFCCTGFVDTPVLALEFYVHMQRRNDAEAAAKSWQKMAQKAHVKPWATTRAHLQQRFHRGKQVIKKQLFSKPLISKVKSSPG